MTFNAANFTNFQTDPLTGQHTADYDAGADTDATVQGSGYFPTSTGLVAGDFIFALCTHNGTAGKIMTLFVSQVVGGQVHTSKAYSNF